MNWRTNDRELELYVYTDSGILHISDLLHQHTGNETMRHTLKKQETSMLHAKIEILLNERQNLLKTTGAAAVFIANLDCNKLPEGTYEAAEMLSNCLNGLSEDTLRDALEKVKAELTPGE